jgi:hypothetical protein
MNGNPSQFYIGYPPTTSATTATTPQVLLTGQEQDTTLLMFSLNNQAMNSFSSLFDGNNDSANKLIINGKTTPIMTFTGKGYIGIGTTAPTSFFHVQGNMYVDGSVYGVPKISDVGSQNQQLAMSFAVYPGSPTVLTIQPYKTNLDEAYLTSVIFKFSFANNATKTFVIPHPNDKQRYLVHTSLEGPENGVRYRGVVTLKNGRAEITLPEYVSDFTDPETATIHLRADATGESLRVVYKKQQWIRQGRVMIESENPTSNETVNWTIQLTRTDLPALVVTPPKNLVHVKGTGPYKSVKGSFQ